MYKYSVLSNQFITNNIFSLKIKAQSEKDIFDFKPGQYVAISFTKDGRPSPVRCFSIANSPGRNGLLEFGIRLGGLFTRELSRLKPSDEILVRGPFGKLVLNPEEVDHAILIAGGIGITPFISMIRTSLTRKWSTKITLLYSSKSWQETAYAQELLFKMRENPNFKTFFFLTNENKTSQNTNIINGPITTEQIGDLVKDNFSYQKFYLCGPPGFMFAMRKILLDKNVSPERIIFEDFSQTGAKTPLQSKVNFYTLAAIVLIFIFILIGDALKTNTKLADVSISQEDRQTNINQPRVETTQPIVVDPPTKINPPIPSPVVKPKPITTPPIAPTSTVQGSPTQIQSRSIPIMKNKTQPTPVTKVS